VFFRRRDEQIGRLVILNNLTGARWNIEILFRAWKQVMNPEAALNRRGSALHHQTLVLTAIIYKMLTIIVVNLLKPTMRR
jgi:IS4 transposase